MPTGQKLSDYKLIYPKDWDDYAKTRDVFNKEWNAMLGLCLACGHPSRRELRASSR